MEEREKAFQDLVETMKMKHHLTSKLTLMDMLSIGSENLLDEKPKTMEELPWTFLRRLMALKKNIRDTLIEKDKSVIAGDDDNEEDDDGELIFCLTDKNTSTSIHPLDVLCVLLHCSNMILQQEIVTKMAMCQFAVPLLLPAGDGSHCTLMLWAMRDIVKIWRPQLLANSKGFKEDSVVNISMPIFSFARLGSKKLSKSKMLNYVLNPDQQQNNFFIHNNMEGGNIQRKISDGLVEISWYFPTGKSDVFPEPIAVTNLRGDLESNWNQFLFLTQVSSAVFIFMDSMSQSEFKLLSSRSNTDTQYYFIVIPGPGKDVSTETQKSLQDLQKKLHLKKTNLIMYKSDDNKASFVKELQGRIVHLLKNDQKSIELLNLESKTHRLNINVDEKSNPECQKAMVLASNITEGIKNMSEYKRETMKLQGELWKELSKVEKELCRMTHQSSKKTTDYQDELKQIQGKLHEEQRKHDIPNGIVLFIDAITHSSTEEKQYFLKWMKCKLDSLTRDHIFELNTVYKEKSSDCSKNHDELKQIDQQISESSVGTEHFLREMGQLYEAEYYMTKENSQRQFKDLPAIAADLLLGGFTLELIDGDASNIPLQWITHVMCELNRKTGGTCKMRVISVLGVQGTGKSTLLNTMFGLQFPVSSGRCTRGAFMTLLPVKQNFQNVLGCEFILVIDTEGLKAPELDSLEGSYEHDNELATVVVGLSDITIVNMAMENTTEMKDILQIVVHAFLRMKEVGKKPKCQFVHQNASDVSAYDKNMRDKRKLLEQLNEMTKIAAGMEKKHGIKAFSDVMDYDLEKDNWYIPGLWLGVPPMAPVNSGYSEHVYELNKYLLEIMKSKELLHTPLSIAQFIGWIESLWNAVKHENFIFSFRNSLVAEAYNKLSIQFSQWEWDFQKSLHDWLISTEIAIKNMSESINEDKCSEFRNELKNLVLTQKHKIVQSVEDYFGNKSENAHLIERHKEDFKHNAEFLKNELLRNTNSKIEEAVSIQKGKFKVQEIQNTAQKLIEDKINYLFQSCREKNQKLDQAELVKEFEEMWKQALADQQIRKLQRLTVSEKMLWQLRNDMSNKGKAVNEELSHVKDLAETTELTFKMDKKYVESGFIHWVKHPVGFLKNEYYGKIEYFAFSLINTCAMYVTEKVNTAEDYNEAYSQELLQMINTDFSKEEKDLLFSVQFELDIKLHILARASQEFQNMHDTFIAKNDPKCCLEKLMDRYSKIFVNTFQDTDVCQSKAEEFCERCLKPAMTDYMFRHLGKEIVDNMVQGQGNELFNSKTFFQGSLLEELLKEKSSDKYVSYIFSYQEYTISWIQNHIVKKYANAEILKNIQQRILSKVTNMVSKALRDERLLRSPSVSEFLRELRDMLRVVLVIPENEMQMVIFRNTASVRTFSSNIQLSLKGTAPKILDEMQSMDIKSVLNKMTVNPVNELFRKVNGCGKKCPFCRAPCEAGGNEHKEHFVTLHRPQGLGTYRWAVWGWKWFWYEWLFGKLGKPNEPERSSENTSEKFECSADICTTLVASNDRFVNLATKGKKHKYKKYKEHYPDWQIQQESNTDSPNYWKYVFVKFNKQFAELCDAQVPNSWKDITYEQAQENLQKMFKKTEK